MKQINRCVKNRNVHTCTFARRSRLNNVSRRIDEWTMLFGARTRPVPLVPYALRERVYSKFCWLAGYFQAHLPANIMRTFTCSLSAR